MRKLRYYQNCVNWPESDVHAEGGLCDMIQEATDISRKTFLLHLDREDLNEVEDQLSYARHPSQGLTMAGDYHVSYHRSKLHGKRVYFFKHSAIEYVFTEPERCPPHYCDNQGTCHYCGIVMEPEWAAYA